jgi:ribonucleoside-diphosphate reductase alpha chain
LTLKFLQKAEQRTEDNKLDNAAAIPAQNVIPTASSFSPATPTGVDNNGDAPACHECGAIMVRSGSCYRCMNCGSSSGCS